MFAALIFKLWLSITFLFLTDRQTQRQINLNRQTWMQADTQTDIRLCRQTYTEADSLIGKYTT